MKTLYRCFASFGSDRLIWSWGGSRLRILCYHGVCEDRLAGSPWLPEFFVTRSQFEAQLQYLRNHATVIPLLEASRRLRDGNLPPRAVAITFDDGYANNLELAYPLLETYDIPAAIFISSAYTECGGIYPFLRLKLLALAFPECRQALPVYKSSPLDVVIAAADRWSAERGLTLTPDQIRTLRPLTVDDLTTFDPQLVEIGSHTHTHTILSNESRMRRDREITHSIGKLTEWTGRQIRAFSYPNGQAGNFDAADKELLRSDGIEVAVSGIAGSNDRGADTLELRRYPIGIYHDNAGFRAEVTGFRSAVRQAAGRLGL